MARLRFRGRRQPPSRMLLLVALGALTGLALGVVMAERAGARGSEKARSRKPSHSPNEAQLDEDFTDDLVPDSMDEFDTEWDVWDDDDGEKMSPDDRAARPPDEAELEARVLEVFRNDPTLRGRAIDIGAIGNATIELTGWVHSADELAHALTLARGVPDVGDVMDSLTVRGAANSRVGQSPTDR